MKYNADCHIHIGLPNKEINDEELRALLQEYKDAGITFIRDGGDKFGVSKRAKAIAKEMGMDYRTCIFPICKKGLYGAFLGKTFDTQDEYKALVDEAIDEGADFIKIMVSGVVDFSNDTEVPALSSDEIASMVGYAHGKGLSVMCHVNGAEAIRSALSAGVDSIEHGFYMDEDTAALLAASDTVWVPTVAPATAFVGDKKINQDNLKKIMTEHMKMIGRVWYLGGMIALGTDAGCVGTPHVESIDKEYDLLKAAIDDVEFDAHLEMSQAQIAWKFNRQ